MINKILRIRLGLILFFQIASGYSYSQCLKGDCINGKGVKMYPDSGKFDGLFEKGQRKQGKYTYASGDTFDGSFKNNLRSGYGVYTYMKGQSFKGIYVDDKKEFGVFKYLNGDEYTGSLKDNKPDGFGVMRLASGEVIEGMWLNGQPDWKIASGDLSFNAISDTSETYAPESNLEKGATPRMFAVVVGIADYQGSSSDLNFSDDDARVFYNHLRKAFPRETAAGEVTLLVDSKATKSAILSAINNSFSKASEGDFIIFFFSGHGGKGSFVPYDLTSNSLTHQEVKSAFKNSSAKYRLCIADACFSGSVGNGNTVVSNYDAAQELRDARLAVLLSSNNEQTSMELGQLGQGLFSYWLMNGLRGAADLNKDKYVTAGELFVYTRNAVVQQSGGRQSPVVIGQQLDKIPLCKLK
jgi:hypothetical protein